MQSINKWTYKSVKLSTYMSLSHSVHCSGTQNFSPKRKFWGRISRGHPGVIRADIPAQNFGQGPQNLGKTSIWARTSMTRRHGRPRPWDFQKLRSEKLWAEFAFPNRLLQESLKRIMHPGNQGPYSMASLRSACGQSSVQSDIGVEKNPDNQPLPP